MELNQIRTGSKQDGEQHEENHTQPELAYANSFGGLKASMKHFKINQSIKNFIGNVAHCPHLDPNAGSLNLNGQLNRLCSINDFI